LAAKLIWRQIAITQSFRNDLRGAIHVHDIHGALGFGEVVARWRETGRNETCRCAHDVGDIRDLEGGKGAQQEKKIVRQKLFHLVAYSQPRRIGGDRGAGKKKGDDAVILLDLTFMRRKMFNL
jgi:hypothetical protein